MRQGLVDYAFLASDIDTLTLAEVLEYMDSQNAIERPYRCAKCGGEGKYPGSKDSLDPADTTEVTCDQCNGWGSRTVPNRAIIAGYEDVPVEP